MALAMALATAACVGPPAPGAADDGQDYLLGLEPVGVVDASVWRAAPAGCDGVLDSIRGWEIAWAAGEPGLGVIVSADGGAVCVDSWEGISLELARAMGDPSPDPMLPVPGAR